MEKLGPMELEATVKEKEAEKTEQTKKVKQELTFEESTKSVLGNSLGDQSYVSICS